VLDACRADLFAEVVDDSERMTSVGSTSRTWLSRTFGAHSELDNIGYITGNPFWTEIEHDEVGYFHVQNIEMTDHVIETVPPTVLTERAVEVWRRRSELEINKLVIHFMQPHTPFRSEPGWFEQAIGEDSWSANV